MLTSMGDVMREAYKRGWITTRDGNISVRRQDKFYITPSGVRKTIIHPEHILKYKIDENGQLVSRPGNPQGKPSGELEMHRLLQTTCCFPLTGCRSVVHLHPTYTIAALEAGFSLMAIADRLQELSRFTSVGPSVKKLPVTSPELAIATAKNFGDGKIIYHIIGQAGHGVTAVAKSPWDAFEHIERLEHACQIILASGIKP